MKKILITILILFTLTISSCSNNNDSNNNDSIDISLMNHNEYIEYSNSVYTAENSKTGTFPYIEYSRLRSTVYAKLNESFEIIEAIVISYNFTIYYNNYASTTKTSGTIVITDKEKASDYQLISLPVTLKTWVSGSNLPEGKLTIVSISGKIKPI